MLDGCVSFSTCRRERHRSRRGDITADRNRLRMKLMMYG
jgi:hypothetical protein